MAGFQEVSASRYFEAKGKAAQGPNFKGNFMPEKVILHDHFIADPSEQDWVEEESNGGTIAQAAANGGTVTLTLGGTNDDVAEFSHAAQWSAAKNCVMEARVKVDDITNVGINIGWLDADMSTNDQIGFEITAGAATLVDVRGSDGAVFVFDTDGNSDVWYVAATKADAEGTPVTLNGATNGATTAPVAATYANFRVALNSDGDATFYYNGEAVGFLPTAVTVATLQCPYVANIAREGAAKVATVDRITCWQDE